MSASNSLEYLKNLMEVWELAINLYPNTSVVNGSISPNESYLAISPSDTGIYAYNTFHPKLLCRNYTTVAFGSPYYVFKNKFCSIGETSLQRMKTSPDKFWYVKSGLWLDRDFKHVMSIQVMEGTYTPVLVIDKNFVYGDTDPLAKFILNKIIKKSHEFGYDIHLIDSSFLGSRLFSAPGINDSIKKEILDFIKNEPESKTCGSHSIYGDFFQV